MIPIVNAPNPVLSQRAKPILTKAGKMDKEIIQLIENMKQTLAATKDPEGVGLAAPQVGKSVRLFIIKPTPKGKVKVFINPQITFEKETENSAKGRSSSGRKKGSKLEGCLSLPDIWGVAQRALSITVSYLDENAKPHTQLVKGFPATIIQHECDHLDGILFPKRVLEQNQKLYKSHKNEKGEEEFEELELL